MREKCLRVPALLEPLDLSGGTGIRRMEWQKETKSRLGRSRMTSGENEGRSPPWQGGLSEGLIQFCFYLSGLPIDRISIQLLKNLSFRLTWTDQPIERTGGICNAIWRAFCVLSTHVASGNSFNASLFLIQFRDYPNEVDCRKPSKKKEKKEEEEKLKEVNTSWRAGRVDESTSAAPPAGEMRERDCWGEKRIWMNKKNETFALKPYGPCLHTNRYGMYCTVQ